MRQVAEQKKTFYVVKAPGKVTGVNFSGFGKQYADKDKRITGMLVAKKQYGVWINRKYYGIKVWHGNKDSCLTGKYRPKQEDRIVTGRKSVADIEIIPQKYKETTVLITNPGRSREEIIRKCGIREGSYGMTGIKPREERVESILSDESVDIAVEPRVCSLEERERIRKKNTERYEQQKVDKIIGDKADRKSTERKDRKQIESDIRKLKTDETKQAMLRNYIIRELIHEEGKTDPESHWKLLGKLVKHDVRKILAFIAKQFWKVIKPLIFGFLIVLLLVFVLLIPFILILYFLMSPAAYFMGVYDKDDTVRSNPQYISNVVQEMYTDFYGQINAFSDRDSRNEVNYAYGQHSEAEEVLAVYMAKLYTAEDYVISSGDDNYPSYLFVDTEKESRLLEDIFEEFNYYSKENIRIEVTNEDGETDYQEAEKMTVYCLTIDRWKDEHFNALSDVEQEMLITILEQNSGEEQWRRINWILKNF